MRNSTTSETSSEKQRVSAKNAPGKLLSSARKTPTASKSAADLRIGHIEAEARAAGFQWVLGVDEAGRGPLAGPVTAGGVLLNLDALHWCDGIADSKALTARRRDALRTIIGREAPGATTHHVSVEDVDRRNVLGASLWAMRHCANALLSRADVPRETVLVVVDGKQSLIDFDGPQDAVIKGDARSLAVAAASILAKVERDEIMIALHDEYPVYGFDRHKGYPTKAHLEALRVHGASPHHRRSFAPVAATLSRDGRS